MLFWRWWRSRSRARHLSLRGSRCSHCSTDVSPIHRAPLPTVAIDRRFGPAMASAASRAALCLCVRLSACFYPPSGSWLPFVHARLVCVAVTRLSPFSALVQSTAMDIASLVNPEPQRAASEPSAFDTKKGRPVKMRGKPGKAFACPHAGCSSSFSRNSDRRRHLKIHEGIRPHGESRKGKLFDADALQRAPSAFLAVSDPPASHRQLWHPF